MPLSEFHRAATKKLESKQSKMTTCTSDVSSFMPDHDFAELLWENGQIVMQGQSNRPKKSSYPTPFPPHSLRVQEKDGRDAAIQKFGQFEALDTTVNELSPAVPCANIGLNTQDDDMSPWINYPMEDPLCSEFFSEFAGINPNPLVTEGSNAFAVKDHHNVENGPSSKAPRESSEPGRLKSNHLFQLPSPQQCQSSAANGKSRLTGFSVSGSGTTSTHQGQFPKQELGSGSKNLQGSSGIGLMNFSHFMRPASFARANSESLGRLKMNERVSSATVNTNPIESTLMASGVRGNSGLDLHKVETRSAAKGKGDVVSVEQQRSEAICCEDVLRNNDQNNSVVANNNGTSSDRHINRQSSSFAASVAVGRQEAEMGPEAVVASSSVCSGNSAGAASNDPKHRAKRKNREGEESGYHSEDLDDDSTGLKKPAAGLGGTSMKRSRAAEVHNLSERRRRDRINEKMRALQELIPNCNKVDKASMLDEAIEYLKTLQLQVQMMSMGSGLCMPPMMLPPRMQHIRTPHMAHFSPMGMGMSLGMGLSYGMGMLDVNGSPMIPVPSMHTPQFPCSSIPGATGLHGIPGSTGLQLFGIPGHGQGLPTSMPRAPLFSPMSGLAANGSSMNEVSGAMVNPLPISDAGPSPKCKDQPQQQQCIDLESTQKPSNSEPQVARKSFEQAQLLQIGNQAQLLQIANRNATSNSIGNTGNASNR